MTSLVILTFGRSLNVLRIKLCRSFVFVPFVYLKVRWIKKNPVDRVIIEEWLSDADSFISTNVLRETVVPNIPIYYTKKEYLKSILH